MFIFITLLLQVYHIQDMRSQSHQRSTAMMLQTWTTITKLSNLLVKSMKLVDRNRVDLLVCHHYSSLVVVSCVNWATPVWDHHAWRTQKVNIHFNLGSHLSMFITIIVNEIFYFQLWMMWEDQFLLLPTLARNLSLDWTILVSREKLWTSPGIVC